MLYSPLKYFAGVVLAATIHESGLVAHYASQPLELFGIKS